MSHKPPQMVSETTKNTKEWQEPTVDYYIAACLRSSGDYEKLYNAATGKLDTTEYNYITNPFNHKGRDNLKSYPAKLRNYAIIPGILNLLIGEKRNRKLKASVIVDNPDVVTKKDAERARVFNNIAKQLYVNELNELGQKGALDEETGMPTVPVSELQKIVDNFDTTYKDKRAINGQHILNILYGDLELSETFLEGFKDWCISGRVFMVKDIQDDRVIHKRVNVENVGYLAGEGVRYIEDAEAFSYTQEMTPSGFLDQYYDKIDKEIIEYLNTNVNGSGTDGMLRDVHMGLDDSDIDSYFRNSGGDTTTDRHASKYDALVRCTYVAWRAWTKKKRVTFKNLLGEETTLQVEVGVSNKDLKALYGEDVIIQEIWVTQIWEGYKLDDTHYFGIQKIPHLSARLDSPTNVALPANGRIKKIGDKTDISIVELLMPFQHLYNFGHFKLNHMLAKNKDKVVTMPLSLLPNRDDFDEFSMFYYMEAAGVMLVDDEDDRDVQRLNAVRQVDLGLNDYIKFMLEYLRAIKSEAETLIDLNPQRMSAIETSAGKGTTQQAIFQSSLITLDLFAQYEEFEERELNSLLNMSKFAFRKGLRRSYVSPEGRDIMLDLEPKAIENGEYGVRVVKSAEEQEKIRMLRENIHAFAQNQAKPSLIAEIIDNSTSFRELTEKVKEIEEKEAALEQQRAEAERENVRAIQEMASKDKERELEKDYYKTDNDNQTKIKVAEIQASAKAADNNTSDSSSSVESSNNINKEDPLDREGENIREARDRDIQDKELDLKNKEINSKERMNKEDNKTALKNKVAGEK